MIGRLGWKELQEIRRQRGRSALLHITDRGPAARVDGPAIADFALFGEIVEWLCAQPLEVVSIAGGEPFAERRGLSLAVRRLSESGKDVVIHTSGQWAKRPEPPIWIRDVLERCATLFLSPDERCFVNAARAIAGAGAWIVVPVGDDDEAARAETLLDRAFGARSEDFAEPRPAVGRATASSPAIRYDGAAGATEGSANIEAWG